MISEQFMQLGRWDLKLSPDTPVQVRHLLKTGDQIVVTPNRVPLSDPAFLGMSQDLSANIIDIANTVIESARYRGPILELSDGNTSLSGHGLLWYLGNSSGDGPMTRTTSASSRTWVQHLLWVDNPPDTALDGWNGLTKGSVVSAPAGTWPPTGTDPDELPYTVLDRLTVLAEALGAEFYVRPDGTFKHGGVASSLFTTTPEVILQRGREGRDLDLIGLRLVEMNPTFDWWTAVQDGIAYSDAGGGWVASSSGGAGEVLYGADGDDAWYVGADSYPQLTSFSTAISDRAAESRLAEDRLTVSVDTYDPGRWMMPGDWLWTYDPVVGVADNTEATTYQGQHITPAKLRLFGMDWPVRQGMGVYRIERNWGGTYAQPPVCIDLTDYVIFEESPVRLDVGGRSRSYDQ